MKLLILNTPTTTNIIRDMAGGLGFTNEHPISYLPPLELAYLAATLLNKGYEVKILDSDAQGYKGDDIFRVIEEYRPEIIIATISLPTVYKDCLFMKQIRKYSSARIIAKTNIAYLPILKEILARSSADLCIYGECDINIDKIITGEEKSGTVQIKDGELMVGENRIIANLDDLPLPARNLLHNEKYRYSLLGDRVTTMQTSRGCPFPCSYYCPYPLVQGEKWRARSPAHVVWEIEDIVKNHNIQNILFRDATFTLNKERVSHICDLISKKKISINWWCETRVDCLDLELMKIMRMAGCRGMNIGVETGDPQLMQTQAKIGLTLEKLKTIRKTALGLGLRLHFLLMIGLPKETKSSLYETYRLIYDLRPETLGVCIVTPYPGTPLYAEAKQKGWIETDDWTRFGGHLPVMHTDHLSSQDLLKVQRMLHQRFYLLNESSFKSRIKSMILDYRFKRWLAQ
jgi:radical SAM superfamily enzyme YgiQ (UPF0313 family)